MLDAHAKPMAAGEVLNFVQANGQTNRLSTDSAERWGEGSPIRVRDDGLWELDADHDAVRAARQAIRVRIVQVRRWAQTRPDRSAIEAARKRFEQEREANARRRDHGSVHPGVDEGGYAINKHDVQLARLVASD